MSRNNKRAILNAIALIPGISAAELSRTTGLGPQTVSRMLRDLSAAGLVKLGSPRRGLRGQPATPTFLNPDGAFCIGCEIGWRHGEILVQNLGGQVLGHHRWDYAVSDLDTVFAEVATLSARMARLVPAQLRSRIVGVGLSMPSGLGWSPELIGAPTGNALWENRDAVAIVAKATGMQAFRFDAGDAGCWAEMMALPMPKSKNLAYVLVSTFVNSGLIINGQLWENSKGQSADLGSMLVTDCHGMQKPVHLIGSIFALEQRMAAGHLPIPLGNPILWDWENLEGGAEWLSEASWAIAIAIANSAAIATFDVAIVDGVMPRAIVEKLVTRVRTHLAAMPSLSFNWPSVEMGRQGSAAPALGASWLPMYQRYFSRDHLDIAGRRD